MLDLSAEFSEAKPFRKINYRNIPVLDLTAPTQAQLMEVGNSSTITLRNGAVYVHCESVLAKRSGGSRLFNNERESEDRGRSIVNDSPCSAVRCYSTRGALRLCPNLTSSSFFSRWHGLFCSRLGSWRTFIIARIYEL